MFRALFLATLLITLVVNIIFLFAAKDKQFELPNTSTLVSVIEIKNDGSQNDIGQSSSSSTSLTSSASLSTPARRLFLRSNDFYDYSSSAAIVPLASTRQVTEYGQTRQSSPQTYKPSVQTQIDSGSANSDAYDNNNTHNRILDDSISNQNDKQSSTSSSKVVELTSAINVEDKIHFKRKHHNGDASDVESQEIVSSGSGAQISDELRFASFSPLNLEESVQDGKKDRNGPDESDNVDRRKSSGLEEVAYRLEDLSGTPKESLANQLSSVAPNQIEAQSETNANGLNKPLTNQQLNSQITYSNYNNDSKSDSNLSVKQQSRWMQRKYPLRRLQDQLERRNADQTTGMQAIIQKHPRSKEFERKQSSSSSNGNGIRLNLAAGADSILLKPEERSRRVHWQVRGVSGTEMAKVEQGVDISGSGVDIKSKATLSLQQQHRKNSSNNNNNDDNNNGPALNIRVKSSKNHVFISVENIIIYESKTRPTNQRAASSVIANWQQQPRTSSSPQTLHARAPSSSVSSSQTGNGNGLESGAADRSSLSPSSSSSNGDVNSGSPMQSTLRAKLRALDTSLVSFPSSQERLSQTSLPETRESRLPPTDIRNAIGGATFRQTSTELVPAADDNEPETDGSEARGMHVVVLNEYDGRIMSRRVFDTYLPNQDEELCFYLNMIRDGRILVFAIKDEGTFKMPQNSPARSLLQRLGSRHIMNLHWRDMWAFVVRKTSLPETNQVIGRPVRQQLDENAMRANLAEGIAKSQRFSEWAQPVIIDTRVELAEPKFKLGGTNSDTGVAFSGSNASASRALLGLPFDCQWNSGDDDEDRRRANFCARVEGYGRVCDCKHPDPISFKPAKIENSQLNQVPIVVIASDRPHYLYRMLSSLLAVDGVNRSLITVFIDGYYDEPLMVCQLFNLRAVQQKPLSRKSARISHHYKSSLTATFELFPNAQFAIIFEEDLDVARDALIYFNQTLELLKHDKSLYCVSAWNDQGYEHSAMDPTLVYRVETMPGLGWMLSRDLYKRELESEWPSASQLHDWDMWIRTSSIRKGRECLIPDISRTYHFGSMGTNINSYFQNQYFSKHAFSVVPQKRFANLDKLTRDAYEKLIESLIVQARVVRRTSGPGHQTGSESLIHSSVSDGSGTNTTKSDDERYLCSMASTTALGNRTSSTAFITHPAATRSQTSLRLGPILNNSSLHIPDNFKNVHYDESSNGNGAATTNVIYIQMIDNNDYKNWLKLAQCWRIWDLDVRGQHKCMWRLFLQGVQTLVVGVPASPYARFKPNDLVPFDL